MVRTSNNDIRLYTRAIKRARGILSRLCLHLTHLVWHWQIAHQNKQHIFWVLHLHHARRLQKKNILILSNRSTDLNNCYVCLGFLCRLLNPINHFHRDMRHHLDTFSLITQITLTINDALIDAPCGHVVIIGKTNTQETFIISHVLVAFIAIIEHKYFTMLRRAHSSGINIDIRINLKRRHLETACLQNLTNRR